MYASVIKSTQRRCVLLGETRQHVHLVLQCIRLTSMAHLCLCKAQSCKQHTEEGLQELIKRRPAAAAAAAGATGTAVLSCWQFTTLPYITAQLLQDTLEPLQTYTPCPTILNTHDTRQPSMPHLPCPLPSGNKEATFRVINYSITREGTALGLQTM
jgi:hypothetical protein